MSQPCAIQDCKRASRTLCHCCNQNLCRDHFNEHDNLLNSQINPLTDEINALADRISAINIDKITNDSRQKLNQWRIDSHQIIDRLYEQKCKELDQCVNESIDKQRIAIVNLRLKMSELIEKQETTKTDINSLTSTIHTLEQRMNEIEHIRVQTDIHPLMIDDRLIQIGKSKIHQFDLLNLPPAYQIMSRTLFSYNALVCNDRCLLTHMEPNLCLIDQDLSVMKKTNWKHGKIKDMCWSSVLGRFLVIIEKDILLIDEKTLSIERVEQVKGENWFACECANESLYLSRYTWDSSILEFKLLPSIRFIKLWKTTYEPQQKQRIDAIVYNQGTLALLINDKSIQTKLIELRSSETFSTLWSIRLDVKYDNNALFCCLLHDNEWLVSDWSASRLFHITAEGKIKATDTYQSVPTRMTLFRSNILVISSNVGINFHRI